MAFEERTEEKTCSACGTLHRLRWARLPVRELTTVKCCACGHVMFRGKSVRDYYEVQLAS